jgi:hypothetical protein
MGLMRPFYIISILLKTEETYFKFIPADSAEYTISSSGASDSYAKLLDSSGNLIASGDDENGLEFIITQELTAGETYYLFMYDYDADVTCTLTISSGVLTQPVYTADELNEVRNDLSGSYILMSDIDLSDTVWGQVYAQANGTGGWEPIGTSSEPFTGTFDGNGYAISNLFINRSDTDFIGLFGYISGGASVQNVRLVDVDVTHNNNVTGSLVGKLESSTVSGSYAEGAVKGTENVGGLVGSNSGTITNSYAAVDVQGTGNQVGGLVGANASGSRIINSYATGSVAGNDGVGGLAEINNQGEITNSYAVGDVTGNDKVGGLVGRNLNGTIQYSHATGYIVGNTNFGGLSG